MTIRNFFIAFTILLFISSNIFSQMDEDKNWISELGGDYTFSEPIFYEYKHFTKEDVDRAKEKLKSIKQHNEKNDWEGIYEAQNTAVGNRLIFWNAAGGFIDFYYYHWMKTLNYGKIADADDFVRLISEKSSPSNLATETTNLFVKVKLGERHFLVSERYLKNFCEEAVGLRESSFNEADYWLKTADYEKPVFGLPIIPAKYKKYLRYPIEVKIIRVGNKKIIPNEQSTKEFNFDDIHYPITVNAGKNKNLEKDMNFFVEELGEWIGIEKVFQNSSVGFIRRDFDENNREQCWDSRGGNGQIIPCKEIKIGMKVFTKSGF